MMRPRNVPAARRTSWTSAARPIPEATGVEDVFDRSWAGLAWSPWRRLGDLTGERAKGIGVYRLRALGQPILFYVGQSGESVDTRFRALSRGVALGEMPFLDPHVAAPCLWAYKDAHGWQFEFSAAPAPADEQERKALECYLCWQHRLAKGTSPTANFGGFHPLYSKSTMSQIGPKKARRPGIRGRRQAAEFADASAPSTPALPATGSPLQDEWMGLAWSQRVPLGVTVDSPAGPGLYVISDTELRELYYVGESDDIRRRPAEHRGRFGIPETAVVRRTAVPSATIKRHRLELESDLIGHYFALTKRAPVCQFRTKPSPTSAQGPPL